MMGRFGALGIWRWPSKEDRRKVAEALEKVGMGGYASRQIDELSGGQKQRIFVARALVQEADLYLLDEPFVGIDRATEKVLIDLFFALKKEGENASHRPSRPLDGRRVFRLGCPPQYVQNWGWTDRRGFHARAPLPHVWGKHTPFGKGRQSSPEANSGTVKAMFAEFFFDPLMRLPLLGTVLMCIGASLVGVIALIRRSSLLGEMLSHASYPGVVGGVFFVAAIAPSSEFLFSLSSMGGGLIASALALVLFNVLQKRWNVASDNALCIILSLFFGFGVLLASALQFSHAPFFRSLQLFLYGQATTITEVQVSIFAVFLFLITAFLFFFFRQVQMICFDRQFAMHLGVKTKWMERILFFLVLLAIVIGMRSVGLVLLSGMLIAPAIAARHLTSRLRNLFILAASFGAVSALLGNFFSWKLPIWIVAKEGGGAVCPPIGSDDRPRRGLFCAPQRSFSPHRGVCSRWVRLFLFRLRSVEENILKKLWKEKKGKIFLPRFRQLLPHLQSGDAFCDCYPSPPR